MTNQICTKSETGRKRNLVCHAFVTMFGPLRSKVSTSAAFMVLLHTFHVALYVLVGVHYFNRSGAAATTAATDANLRRWISSSSQRSGGRLRLMS